MIWSSRMADPFGSAGVGGGEGDEGGDQFAAGRAESCGGVGELVGGAQEIDAVAGVEFFQRNNTRSERTSHEIRLASDPAPGRFLDYSVGAFYRWTNTDGAPPKADGSQPTPEEVKRKEEDPTIEEERI